MKFNEVLAHLAVASQEPLANFTELLRAVREGTEDRGLQARARGSLWAGIRLAKLFRGKAGPGGGFEANPMAVGFYLTAYMADGPRREAAAKALDLSLAKYLPGPGDNDTECLVTRQRYFGGALMTILSNREVFDRTISIRISSDIGYAEILFQGDHPLEPNVSEFWTDEANGNKPKKPLHRECVLGLDGVRFLFDMINETEAAKTA